MLDGRGSGEFPLLEEIQERGRHAEAGEAGCILGGIWVCHGGRIAENGLAKRNFLFRIPVPSMYKNYPVGSPAEDYSASGALRKPNGQKLNRETCALWEVADAAIRQDPMLAAKRIYPQRGRGFTVNSEIELVGAVAAHYGDRLLTMSPTEIRNAYRIVLSRMMIDAHRFINRNDIQTMVEQALDAERVRHQASREFAFAHDAVNYHSAAA